MGNESITFLDRLVNGLADKGMEIIIASPRKPHQERFLHSERINYLWAPNWEGSALSRILNFLALCILRLPVKRFQWLRQQVAAQSSFKGKFMELHRLLPFTRVRADILYFPWNSAAMGYRGLYSLGIPVVVSCRGSQVNIRPHTNGGETYRMQFKESMENAAAVHCVSHDILNEASKLGLDPLKAVVIHPAVDPAFFQPLKKRMPKKIFTIITTGSLIWTKGYEYALLAIHELIRKGVDCRLEIIGAGPEEERLLYTRHDLGLEKQVTLYGKLSPEKVVERLQQADAFLLSSLSEGISNAVLEAMSCGLPVVTTDCGGMREVVTDGVEGFVVPLRDPQTMAGKLLQLDRDPSLRDRIGQAARERVIRDFDLKDQFNAFHELFTTIARKQ